ncbi:MAG: protein kinase [Kofleriaceae bacterium]
MKTMMSTAGVQAGPVEVSDFLAPGATAGPWVVERELGRGGMGAVYAVVHSEIGKRAALKVVHARLLSTFNPERMVVEAKVVNQIGHPNIVDIFETGKLEDGRPYIVMERLEGQPLAYRADEGKILPDQVIAILLQCCDALIAAHAAGVVHRDLKLDNIFLIDNPEDLGAPRVKILDWGIAKMIHHHDVKHTIDGQLVGTPQYLSPEQARGAQVTPQTDVYSLGVMAYELFLEQLPFEAETAAEVMAMHLRATPPPADELWPDVPPELAALLDQMLAKQPDRRPTMLEVARRLETVRDDLLLRCHRPAVESKRATTAKPLVIVPPMPIRARAPSPVGLMPTLDAGPHVRSRRWQYGIGAFAIVASAAMFIMTRTGDTASASAATTPIQADVLPAEMPVTPPNVVTAMPIAESAPVVVKSTPAPAVRPAAKKVVPGVRKPVTPRLGTKADPNGTLDAYQ